jgi:hypothetical protein
MVRTIPPSKRSFACYLFFLACVAFSNAGASTLSITTPSLMSGDAGVAYSQPLHATGGTAPYQWSLVGSGLPTGLSLSAAGTVSGTPTQAASYVFGVTVLDSSVPQQSLTANVTLTIGHTYYVDSVAGNDSNTGLSSAQPWKTLLKITESKFLPGDAILLKAGDVWNQGSQFNSASTAIQMLSSGTANNPIVLGSYGSGAVPLIDGSGTLTYLVVVKGAYVIVRNLALHNASGYGVDVLASPHVTIQNCSFQNFGAAAINVGDNSPYILVDKNTATNSAGFTSSSGFLRFASISSDNPVISRNTVGDLNSHFGISTTDAMNVQIFGNTVTGNGHNITIEGQTRSVTGGKIYDNTAVGASTLEGDGENITLTGIAPYTVTADIYRNFVQGNANTAHGIAIFNAVN